MSSQKVALLGCLVLALMGMSAAVKDNTLQTTSQEIIGCGAFQEEEFCIPALECFWCDDKNSQQNDNSHQGDKGQQQQHGGGSCMEFDAWINACPDAKDRFVGDVEATASS